MFRATRSGATSDGHGQQLTARPDGADGLDGALQREEAVLGLGLAHALEEQRQHALDVLDRRRCHLPIQPERASSRLGPRRTGGSRRAAARKRPTGGLARGARLPATGGGTAAALRCCACGGGGGTARRRRPAARWPRASSTRPAAPARRRRGRPSVADGSSYCALPALYTVCAGGSGGGALATGPWGCERQSSDARLAAARRLELPWFSPGGAAFQCGMLELSKGSLAP